MTSDACPHTHMCSLLTLDHSQDKIFSENICNLAKQYQRRGLSYGHESSKARKLNIFILESRHYNLCIMDRLLMVLESMVFEA